MSLVSESLVFASRTDPGRVRKQNEDAILVEPECGLVVLADGMGGYNAGEIASAITIALVGNDLGERFALKSPSAENGDGRCHAEAALEEVLVKANDAVHEAARSQSQYKGMGTTVVAAVFHRNRVTVAHIGDSRLYRWRAGRIEVLTRDHSILQEQLDAGLITPEQARVSRNRNLVTRALGVDPVVKPEIHTHVVEIDDIYLLCSDGLNDMVEDAVIGETVGSLAANPDLIAEHLIALANDNGGRDNVSVILAKVVKDFAHARSWWQVKLQRLAKWFT